MSREFNEQEKYFRESIRYEQENNKHKNQRKEGPIQTIPLHSRKGEARKAQQRRNEQLRKQKEARNKKIRKIKLRIGALIAAGVVSAGSIGAIAIHNDTKPVNDVREAFKAGETLNTLGIDMDVIDQIEEIDNILANEDIQNADLLSLAPKINNLQFDTIKTKLANTLGVDETDISLHSNYTKYENGGTTESIKIRDGETYSEKEDLFDRSNTISKDIASYIIDITTMQDLMGKLQTKDINRNDLMKEYKQYMERIKTFAAAEMVQDEKGNISMEYIKAKDVEKQDDTRQEYDEER